MDSARALWAVEPTTTTAQPGANHAPDAWDVFTSISRHLPSDEHLSALQRARAQANIAHMASSSPMGTDGVKAAGWLRLYHALDGAIGALVWGLGMAGEP